VRCAIFRAMVLAHSLSIPARYGFHEKIRLRLNGDLAPANDAKPQWTKRAKHVAIPEVQSRPITTTKSVADEVTFDSILTLLMTALEDTASSDAPTAPAPSAEDLLVALHDFETRHPQWAAVALNLFSPRVAAVQNAVGPTLFPPN